MRALLFLLALLAALPSQALQLVATIEPLAALVRPLMGPGDQLQVLLPASQSPHQLALKPSQRQWLEQADLVLWVGPELERALAPHFANSERSLAFSDLTGLSWPEEQGGQHQDHGHTRDPHVWLNPDNARLLVAALAERLAALALAQAPDYRTRAQQFDALIATTAETIRRQFAGQAPAGFMVLHEGYGHWNQYFRLQQLAAVGLTPEQKPGARHLYELQQQARQASCLLAERFYDTPATENLARQLGLPLVWIDPLGAESAGQPDAYLRLLRELAASFGACGSGD